MARSPAAPSTRADRTLRGAVLGAALAILGVPALAPAQDPTLRATLPGWIGLIAAPGRERPATDAIERASPGWRRGALGTLVRQTGSGAPRRVIACSLDRAAYSVSEIRSDGFLRVHDAQPARQHPLWDQQHEGQRVLVQSRSGAVVPGVFGVRSTHLWRRRPGQDLPATTDDLWLDVGARSAAEVASLGIRLLDPVVRELPAWTYGDTLDPLVAGPGASARTGCAVVAAMSAAKPRTGTNVYVIATQSSYGDAGLTAAIARMERVDELLVLLPQTMADAKDAATVASLPARTAGVLGAAVGRTRGAAVRARQPGTLLESVRASDADAFAAAMAAAADVPAAALRPIMLPAPHAAPPTTARRAARSTEADLLARLTDAYGVAGHEAPVRDAVLAELPAWAREAATVDSAGNLVVAVGPQRDTTVVIAHLDEIGFEVAKIARDGTVSLAPRGGFFPSLWEGQPALLHAGEPARAGRPDGACAAASAGPLRGVFSVRDSAARKQPQGLTAWFGLDSAALAARGVGVGSSITAYKCAARLAGTRFTARAIDDRVGSMALVLAARELDPGALRRRVVLVWSVREETGLEGARVVAAALGPGVRRVHAVDTFVASDSPLESTRFANTPIGAGAVLRALDNSSVTSPAETDRIVELARTRGIPLQVGTTNGGNDGSELVRYGAEDVPLAWPARYSHSPVETIDLRDARALADIVRAVLLAP